MSSFPRKLWLELKIEDTKDLGKVVLLIFEPFVFQKTMELRVLLPIYQCSKSRNRLLGGGFNPFEKYARQIGAFSQIIGMKIPKIFELPPT